VLNVALVIATMALSLADKSGLAIVTGLVTVATAATLARWWYRLRPGNEHHGCDDAHQYPST
jgi:hypothetical protein